MRLEWSAFALADREAIFDFIEADSPRAAAAVDDRIREQAESLIAFPEKGRPGRVEATRELVVGGTPYVAVYRLGENRITIIRILHGAQAWP